MGWGWGTRKGKTGSRESSGGASVASDVSEDGSSSRTVVTRTEKRGGLEEVFAGKSAVFGYLREEENISL